MLIGITGGSGNFKTVIAKHLEKVHGFDRIHAGMPVKKAMRAGFDMPRGTMKEAIDRPTARLGGGVPRDVSEAMAAALHRTAPNATSEVLQRRVAKRVSQGKSVVVDGIRSPVEAATLRRMGGYIVRADNGKSIDPAKPMDVMQQTVQPHYKIETDAMARGDKGAKGAVKEAVDNMLGDIRNCDS